MWKAGTASRPGLILPDLTCGAKSTPVSLVNDIDGEKGLHILPFFPLFGIQTHSTQLNLFLGVVAKRNVLLMILIALAFAEMERLFWLKLYTPYQRLGSGCSMWFTEELVHLYAIDCSKQFAIRIETVLCVLIVRLSIDQAYFMVEVLAFRII
ncbi:Histone-lysine N-methyltransferase, H3 lysine-9 specific SUVH3-like protein [Drosera capensis]